MTPKKKSQGIPLGPGHLAKAVVGLNVARFLAFRPAHDRGLAGLGQIVTEDLQVGQARHHAEKRRQVQKVVEGYGGRHGAAEQEHDAPGAAPHHHLFVGDVRCRLLDEERHDNGRDDVVDHRGNEQREEGPEVDDAPLPDHQSGDVAERAESAAGIRRDHDVHAADADEAPVAVAHRQHHRAHHQRRGEVVDDGREEEADDAGDPEKLPVTETVPDEPGAQRIEYAPVAHRVDVGHGGEQEEEQFAELDEEVAHRLLGCVGHVAAGVLLGDKSPDDSGAQHHRHRFPQVREFFGDHKGIGEDENSDYGDSDPVRSKIHGVFQPIACVFLSSLASRLRQADRAPKGSRSLPNITDQRTDSKENFCCAAMTRPNFRLIAAVLSRAAPPAAQAAALRDRIPRSARPAWRPPNPA